MKRLNKIHAKLKRTAATNMEILKFISDNNDDISMITKFVKLINNGDMKVNDDGSVTCYHDDAAYFIQEEFDPDYVSFSDKNGGAAIYSDLGDVAIDNAGEKLGIDDYDELYEYLKNYYRNKNLLDGNDLLLPADKKFPMTFDMIYYDDILEYLDCSFDCDSTNNILTFYFE